MQNDPNNVWQKLKKWSAVILLAALCIGGTELAVCRMVDPELYDSITAPVREGAAQGLRMAQEGAAMLGRGLEALGQGAQDVIVEPLCPGLPVDIAHNRPAGLIPVEKDLSLTEIHTVGKKFLQPGQRQRPRDSGFSSGVGRAGLAVFGHKNALL